MKKLIFLFLLFVNYSFATVITVTNPGAGADIRANLVTAIGSAVDGDIISFGTMSVTCTPPTITTTKKISFVGTDTTNTIIVRPESSSDASLLNQPIITIDGSGWGLGPSGVRVTGIKFKSQIPSADDAGADGGSLALDQAVRVIKVTDFEIYNCSFWYFGNGAIRVDTYDYFARGLIYNNGFYLNAKGASGLGYGYGVVMYGENLQWIANVNASGNNFIFIEDNIFSWHSHAIAAGGCAKYVSRYNHFYKNVISENVSKHAIDGHGWQGGSLGGENYFSTRLMISYMDTLINDIFFDRTAYVSNGTTLLNRPMERAILSRGGQAIVHNDYIIGYRFAVSISTDGGAANYPYPFGAGYQSASSYPSTHTGSSYSKGAGDVFFWNISYSVYDGSNGDGTSFWNYKTSDFLNDRDYHESTDATDVMPGYSDYTYPHPRRTNQSN